MKKDFLWNIRKMERNDTYIRWDAEMYFLNDGGRAGGGTYSSWLVTEEDARASLIDISGSGCYYFIHATNRAKEQLHDELFDYHSTLDEIFCDTIYPSFVAACVKELRNLPGDNVFSLVMYKK